MCISIASLPKAIHQFSPNSMPSHPGSHMNVDVIRRSNQKIIVCADMFSSFTTAAIINGETRENLEHALISIVTPIRNAPKILIRTDNAPAFKSLVVNPSAILSENGIMLELGHDANKNSNAIVDKIIQELEYEIKKLAPGGEAISEGRLGHAVTILNSRARTLDLSASEIHFSRDPVTSTNLHLDDAHIAKLKTDARNQTNAPARTTKLTNSQLTKGDIVVVTNEGTKHTARSQHLVTDTHGNKSSLTKIIHADETQTKAPKFSPVNRTVDNHFLTIVKKAPSSSLQLPTQDYQVLSRPSTLDSWIPSMNPDTSESDDSEDEDQGNGQVITTNTDIDNPTHEETHETAFVNPRTRNDTDTTPLNLNRMVSLVKTAGSHSSMTSKTGGLQLK